MNIVAILRILNEEQHIARCCRYHQWCDHLLIADGGSKDTTVEIASQFPNVQVRPFEKRITFDDGSFMNPEPAHFNFLLDWADEVGADWLVIPDADSWPAQMLRHDARTIFEGADEAGRESIFAYQLYLWGEDEYFPKINKAGQAQWAWKANLGLRYDESGNNFFETTSVKLDLDKALYLDVPYVILHYFSDPKRELVKMRRYQNWGHPKTHILESIYAPPEPLPDWVREQL